MDTWGELRQKYKTRLLLEHELTESTVNGYLKKLRIAFNQVGGLLSEENCFNYIQKIKLENKSSSFINNSIYAIQWYFKLFMDIDIQIPKKKQVKRELNHDDILSDEEVRMLFSSCRNFKDYAIFSVLIYGGLRPKEVRMLHWKDIKWDQNEVFVRDPKNKLADTRVVHKNCIEALKRWKAICDHTKERNNVFLDKNRKPYTEKNFYKYLHTRFQWAGIKKRPYALRHTLGTTLIDASGDLFFVKNQMGHKHIMSTMKYLHFVNKEVRKEKYEQNMPVFD